MYTSQNTGKFRVVETKNPDKYEGKWSQDIDIFTFDGSISKTYTATNTSSKKEYGTISINKIDSYSGDKVLVTDAEFTIYEWNKDKGIYEDTCEATAKTFDPSQSGNNKTFYASREEKYKSYNIYITDKNLGKFKVVETKNPSGYFGDWSKEFMLKKEVEAVNLNFEVVNKCTVLPMGEIQVEKAIPVEDIYSSHGNATFRFTVSGTDEYGEKHIYQDYVSFNDSNGTELDISGKKYKMLVCYFKNVPVGTYEVIEGDTVGFKFNDIKSLSSNTKVYNKGNSGYANVVLSYNKSTSKVDIGSCRFVNNKLSWDNYRHTDIIRNKNNVNWN